MASDNKKTGVFLAGLWCLIVLAGYYRANADYYVSKVSGFIAFIKSLSAG